MSLDPVEPFDLFAHLDERVRETGRQAMDLADEAAPSLAFVRTADKNQQIVDAALVLAENEQQRSPGQIVNPTFMASLAALPETAYERSFTRLRQAVMASPAFARRVGWRDLSARIKKMHRQLSLASDRERTGTTASGLVFDSGDYLGIAQAFVDRCQIGGYTSLVVYGGRWFQYEAAHGIYQQIEAEALDGMLYTFLSQVIVRTQFGDAPIATAPAVVTAVQQATASIVHLPVRPDAMFWRDGDTVERPDPQRLIPFRNAVLDVDGWLTGKRPAVIEHTPALFVTRRMPVHLDLDATCPQFERFVSQITGGDAETIRSLQLHGGYWLLPDTSLQTVTIFQGPGGTGKGTFLRIFQGLLGGFAVAPNLEQLSTLWGFENLQGAHLAVMSDIHDAGDRAGSAVEKILRLSGEDAVDVHRKGEKALRNQRLVTRLLIVINEALSLPDKSGALYRRLVVIVFNQIFSELAQDSLSERLLREEGPGIARWFLEGLRVLEHMRASAHAAGIGAVTLIRKQLQPTAGIPALERLRELGSAALVFVQESCELGSTLSIPINDLYDEWKYWRENNGVVGRSKTKFVADLMAATKGAVRQSQVTLPDGSRQRVLEGITVRSGTRRKHYEQAKWTVQLLGKEFDKDAKATNDSTGTPNAPETST